MGNGNFIFFSFLYQFSILFNENFAFLQFFMLFNGKMRLKSFGGGGGTDGRTDIVMDVWKLTHVSYRRHESLGETDGWTNRRTDRQTDEQNPPVFYRTSFPSGKLPCFLLLHFWASCIKDWKPLEQSNQKITVVDYLYVRPSVPPEIYPPRP